MLEVCVHHHVRVSTVLWKYWGGINWILNRCLIQLDLCLKENLKSNAKNGVGKIPNSLSPAQHSILNLWFMRLISYNLSWMPYKCLILRMFKTTHHCLSLKVCHSTDFPYISECHSETRGILMVFLYSFSFFNSQV